MPEVKRDATDAAELAEMLQFLSEWLTRDPARLGASLAQFVGHPPTAWPSSVATWSGSFSCLAAATASNSSAPAWKAEPDRLRLHQRR
jgi:hypothetical protein